MADLCRLHDYGMFPLFIPGKLVNTMCGRPSAEIMSSLYLYIFSFTLIPFFFLFKGRDQLLRRPWRRYCFWGLCTTEAQGRNRSVRQRTVITYTHADAEQAFGTTQKGGRKPRLISRVSTASAFLVHPCCSNVRRPQVFFLPRLFFF